MFKYNGIALKINGKWLNPYTPPVDPYNPLNLPPNVVRVRTNDGEPPIVHSSGYTSYETATKVAGTANVYDVYKSGTDFTYLLFRSTNVIEVLGANTTNVTNMFDMFFYCTSLTSVPLFDTSNVTSMKGMFAGCPITSVPLYDTHNVTNMSEMLIGCTALTSVPLFDTSNVTNISAMLYACTLTTVPLFDTHNVTNMASMFENCSALTTVPLFDTSSVINMNGVFWNCTNVESGALALYQQASSQATPPAYHEGTFYKCGIDTVTGAAELEQIPSDWK